MGIVLRNTVSGSNGTGETDLTAAVLAHGRWWSGVRGSREKGQSLLAAGDSGSAHTIFTLLFCRLFVGLARNHNHLSRLAYKKRRRSDDMIWKYDGINMILSLSCVGRDDESVVVLDKW